MNDFKGKHILSIDYGTKKTGISTYKVGIDPFPLLQDRVNNKTQQDLINSLKDIIEAEFIDILVLGIPYLTDGQESKKTLEVKKFKELLIKELKLPVYEQDETLTTEEAKDRMKNSPKFNFKIDLNLIDSLSASIILEDFLANQS